MTNNQLTDLRTLILSEVGDFFAGFGSPGEPETPEEMQRELSMRLGRILNNHIVNYPRCEALVEILRECRIARDEAQAELQERRKAERDSEPVELPLDYLQGHKDGLEWAAQLAKANHPETGDWLYDDPIELAKAIRKGPDIPPAQPVTDSEPVAWLWSRDDERDVSLTPPEDDDDAADAIECGWTATPLYRHAQQSVVPEEMTRSLASIAKEYQTTPQNALFIVVGWNACRAAMLQGAKNSESRVGIQTAPALDSFKKNAESRCGNAPVIPEGWTGNDKANAALMMLDRIETIDSVDDDRIDGIKRIVRELAAATTGIPIISDTWIPVGERMPEDEQEVLTRNRMGHRFVSFFDKHSGLFFDRIDAPAACCIEHVLVTHWMPLPAGPQEVK